MNRIRQSGIILIMILNVTEIKAQYISEVIEYTPAPGQFINSRPWGSPDASASLVGDINGTICLGAFGGYVIFRFENPVENHQDNPFGVDFTVFGNPLIYWSEPGIVWVMKDENENGLPDDTWYELAGSDYHFSSSTRRYRVTYTNPLESIARDVPWADNAGDHGVIPSNSIHNQPYYPDHDSFPSIPEIEYALEGSAINAVVDFSNGPVIRSVKRAFGYADNQLRGSPPYTTPDNPYTEEVENSGGDAFDIGWAVDSAGDYVELDKIHFVKVQNGVRTFGGWLGELSTEVTGAIDVVDDVSISGELDVIVIRDLPLTLETSTVQLEAFVFHQGRLQSGRPLRWTSSMASALVDENQVLTVSQPGNLELTATLVDRPEIRSTVHTTVNLTHTSFDPPAGIPSEFSLSPNPAGDFVRLRSVAGASVSIFNSMGKSCVHFDTQEVLSTIDLTRLPPGIYVVQIEKGGRLRCLKLLKR